MPGAIPTPEIESRVLALTNRRKHRRLGFSQRNIDVPRLRGVGCGHGGRVQQINRRGSVGRKRQTPGLTQARGLSKKQRCYLPGIRTTWIWNETPGNFCPKMSSVE
jgi:hypothetical protein